jgi:O-antigen/teichoic acid export membrane protein
MSLLLTAGIGWWLIPDYGATGAAAALLAGSVGSIITYGLLSLAGVRSDEPPPPTEA